MINFDIKNRFSGDIQFTAEIDCEESEKLSVKLRLAVNWAIKNKCDLSRASLSRADLSGADLRWADLRWADLSWANLSWANLSGADLSGADLRWADLSWANLSGADLSGADLRWASLSRADLLIFQGLGSRSGTLYAYKRKEDSVIEIRTGYFFGTIAVFRVKVLEEYKGTGYGIEYDLLCNLIEQKLKEKD